MHHLELFSASIAQASLVQVALKTPAILNPLQSGVQVSSELDNLMALYGVSATLQRVQAQARSLLPIPYPDVVAVNRGTVFESPVRGGDFSANPVPLVGGEEFDIFAVQGAVGAETVYVAALFSPGPVARPPSGRMFSIHATAATTLTAGAWTTPINPVLDANIPAGLYALVGMRVQCATGRVFRVQPTQDKFFRPGGLCVQAYDGMVPDNQRNGGWGEWLRFRHNLLPAVEIFATAADTAEDFWYDLILLQADK